MMRVAFSAFLLLAVYAPAMAQTADVQVRAAIVPETLSVGAVIHAAVRVRVPPGVRIAFPDTLPMPEDAEAAGTRELRSDTTGAGLELTAIYPITAWKPGELQLPDAAIALLTEDGADTIGVEFPAAHVSSVLPTDTAGIQPRPARDVLGADRVWWPWLAALGVLLALAALAVRMWQRRRPLQAAVPAADVPPREAALALLEHARSMRLAESGDMKGFYTLVAEAVRTYMEAIDPAWGADLTTHELTLALSMRAPEAESALRVLDRADMVKFAKARPDLTTALADWTHARDWVQHFEPAVVEDLETEVAVA